MNEFERKLSEVPLRRPPPGWRRELLAGTEKIAAPEWSWRHWFWPSPAAWGGLAAVWVIFFAVNALERPSPPPNQLLIATSASSEPLYAFAAGRDFDALIEKLAL